MKPVVKPVAAAPAVKPVAPAAKPIAAVKPVAPLATPATDGAPAAKKPRVAKPKRTALKRLSDAMSRNAARLAQVGAMLLTRTNVEGADKSGAHLNDAAEYVNAAVALINAFPADFRLKGEPGIRGARSTRAELVVGAAVRIAAKRVDQYKSMTDDDNDLLNLRIVKISDKRVIVSTADGMIRFPCSPRHLRARTLTVAEQAEAEQATAEAEATAPAEE